MEKDLIQEDEFLRTYYPSAVGDDGKKNFSIICSDPSQSIDSMILWQGFNFLFLSDKKINFVYVAADPSIPSPYVFQEVERYFQNKSLLPILLFRKKVGQLLEFLGMYYVLSRTTDQISLERFKTINPNKKESSYHLDSVLTLIEYKYLEENLQFIPFTEIKISDSLRKWIHDRHVSIDRC